MEQVKPTRMELMKKKAQIKLAEQGRDLLREKMDALIQEFFKILSTVSTSRDELDAISRSADLALLVAQAVDDPVTIRSASFATRRAITVDIAGKNIMGVTGAGDREETGLEKHARTRLRRDCHQRADR